MKFVPYRVVQSASRPGKTDKLPLDYRTGAAADGQDPKIHLSREDAEFAVSTGTGTGIGLVLRPGDRLWCVDLDNCLQPDGTWSPVAVELCERLAGAYIEVSVSKRGLHIIGTGDLPPHGTRNGALGLELYSKGRFIALTGTHATGDMTCDLTPVISAIATGYFPPSAGGSGDPSDWTDGPCEGWAGPVDDDELIRKMLSVKSAAAAFGGAASAQDLWEGNEVALARAFPDTGDRAYDASRADAALAQRLAFWTGKNCERMERLMLQSALARDKWEQRPEYLRATITRACGQQDSVYVSRSAPAREGPSDKPWIDISGGELHNVATAGEDAILASGEAIFQRGRHLVRLSVDKARTSDGATVRTASLVALTNHSLRDVLARVAHWRKFDKRSSKPHLVDPPNAVAEVLLARFGEWRFPSIAGVIMTPTLRPDGSLLSEHGYDLDTKLYHIVDPRLELASNLENPTRKDAEESLAHLRGLLAEFPFVTEVDRAVALSAIIASVVRAAMNVVPLTAVNATAPGSGKSFFVDLCAAICTGEHCPVIGTGKDEIELEKRLGGVLLEGRPILSIDNVTGDLGGGFLCMAVERPLVSIRKLCGSDMYDIPNSITLMATGNQLVIYGDLVRRTLFTNLDAQLERPELRQFTSNPVKTVLANRGLYVSDALRIVRAYIVAGKPSRLPPLASFEEWSDLVRSALVWLGCEDPVLSMQTARDADPQFEQHRTIACLWYATFGSTGLTVQEVVQKSSALAASFGPNPSPPPEFNEALTTYFADRNGINTRRLGKWLSSVENRIVSGLKFTRQGNASGGVVRWAVLPVVP